LRGEHRKTKFIVLCPVCGKYGFLTRRWVKSSYYPKYASEYIISPGLRHEVIGSKYSGQSLKHLEGAAAEEEEKERKREKESFYKVRPNHKYYHYFIGHYDKKKYNKQMIKYRESNIKPKSRPNGRTSCYVRGNVEFYKNNRFLIDSFWSYHHNSIPNSVMDIYHWKMKHGYYHESLPRDCLIPCCKISSRRNKNYSTA
jgi:hypothetical protein